MKISITDCDHGFFDPEKKVIEGAGHILNILQCKTPEEVVRAAHDADAIICQYAPINKDVLQSMPKCRVVGRYGVGLDNIDIEAATDLGIKIVHTPYFCFQEVADHTMGLILALARQIVSMNNLIKSNRGKSGMNYGNMLSYMKNVERPTKQIIGIIGFGKAGKEIAKRAMSFGFKVIAFDPYIPPEIFAAHGVCKVSLEELVRKSDIVTLHAPLTDETRGMIDKTVLAQMKPTAYLVNTARGAIVNETALIEALENNYIAGAALDVTEKEPISNNHPFLRMDNVLLTPHISFYSNTSIQDMKTKVAQYTVNALRGQGEYALANPKVLKNTQDFIIWHT
ncbi:MAG: C-terminal binding protein [Candidatus Methanoperedens sp.]|nr:C-terminal binding protein [Candidatus Methanoperedens sp.]MCZ7394904.1 C-terminal binding protein [Candidatus Methanoperedens sp.]